MTVYVRIKRLNGRNEFAKFAWELRQKGFEDRVEYYQGGCEGEVVLKIAPHLKFENHDDALAYVLAYGGEVSKEMPEYQPSLDFYPGS
jgi:hypothetical protein